MSQTNPSYRERLHENDIYQGRIGPQLELIGPNLIMVRAQIILDGVRGEATPSVAIMHGCDDTVVSVEGCTITTFDLALQWTVDHLRSAHACSLRNLTAF